MRPVGGAGARIRELEWAKRDHQGQRYYRRCLSHDVSWLGGQVISRLFLWQLPPSTPPTRRFSGCPASRLSSPRTPSPDVGTLEGFKVIALRSSASGASSHTPNHYPGQQLQPAPVIDQKTVWERLKGIKYHHFLNLLCLSNKKRKKGGGRGVKMRVFSLFPLPA